MSTPPLRRARHAARHELPAAHGPSVRSIAITSITRRIQVRGGDPPSDSIAELAAELAAVGLSDPVRLLTDDGITYTLATGNTRLLAAEQLGWTEILALVDTVEAITDDVIAEAMRRQYSENRTGRRMTVWETAHYIEWLAENRHLSHAAIVAETRLSSPTVHRYKRILRGRPYEDPIRRHLDQPETTVRAAERLAVNPAARDAFLREHTGGSGAGHQHPPAGDNQARRRRDPASAGERATQAFAAAADRVLTHTPPASPDILRDAARRVLTHCGAP